MSKKRKRNTHSGPTGPHQAALNKKWITGAVNLTAKEGKKLGRALGTDPDLLALDKFTFKEALEKMLPIHKRQSQINEARKRYVFGDDTALEET
jgi:hypothetical protein